MSDSEWRDMIVGERMRVDREFADRVRSSQFSGQQWSLIMTAVEFDLAGEGESAELVADTSKIGAVLPELERIEKQGPMAPPTESGGGLLDSVKSALGMGGPDEELLAAAADLADEYAAELQAALEESGRWSEVREAARPAPE